MLLGQVKRLTPNQYVNVYLEGGKIKEVKVKDRWISSLTLSISEYFTQSYVNVYGSDNCLNQLKYELLHKNLSVECYNCLHVDFEFDAYNL